LYGDRIVQIDVLAAISMPYGGIGTQSRGIPVSGQISFKIFKSGFSLHGGNKGFILFAGSTSWNIGSEY